MILTKKEFLKKFGYKSRNSLTRLIKAGQIVLNNNGDIDFGISTNKKWKSNFLLKQKSSKTKPQKPQSPKTQSNQPTQSVEQLKLLSHENKVIESSVKAELLQLKLAKEKKQVVDSDILVKVINLTFSDLFMNLISFPKRHAVDILNLIAANPEDAQTVLIDFLTQKIKSSLESALKDSRIATKKFIENDKN